MRVASSLLLVLLSVNSAAAQGVVVEDIFGRDLNKNGLVLVDWEGQIANPAIKFFVVPPATAVYGNEYHGEMPQFRWPITKLDLLCHKAVGYPLRATSAFVPLKLETECLPGGLVGKRYSEKLKATGGIPFYHWEITAGKLPVGTSLNAFTGEISDAPSNPGTFDVTIRVRDYDEKATGQSRGLKLEIK